MTTRRDNRIILFLMTDAALKAATMSTYAADLLPSKMVAAIGLLSAMLSAACGIYVTMTRETERIP